MSKLLAHRTICTAEVTADQCTVQCLFCVCVIRRNSIRKEKKFQARSNVRFDVFNESTGR